MSSTTLEKKEEDSSGRAEKFEESDKLDDAQIIDEMKGKVIEQYFYEIVDKVTGKTQPGLSWAGTKWMAGIQATQKGHPISVEHADVMESPDGLTYRASVVSKDMTTGEKRIGFYEQDRYLRKNVYDPNTKKKIGEERVVVDIYNKDGKKVGEEPQRIPFALALAGSKAQRNAIRHFLEEPMIIATYKEWKAQHDKTRTSQVKDVTRETNVKDVPHVPAAVPPLDSTTEVRQPPPRANPATAYTLEQVKESVANFGSNVTVSERENLIIVRANPMSAPGASSVLKETMKAYHPAISFEGHQQIFTIKKAVVA